MKTVVRALWGLIVTLAMGSAWAEPTGLRLLDDAIARRSMGEMPMWYNHPYRQISKAQADEYTRFFVQTLKTDGRRLLNSIPSDIGWYCPNYLMLNGEQRLVFWVRFLSVFPELESGFRADRETVETKGSIAGVVSSGFFQISLDSVTKGGYGCDFIRQQKDLLDWKKNTTCAIRMLDRYMSQSGLITWNTEGGNERDWKGVAKYWGIARGSDLKSLEGKRKLRDFIENNRSSWLRDAQLGRHPALRYREFTIPLFNKDGKPLLNRRGKQRLKPLHLEMMLYRMNQVPFCN